MGGVLSLWVGLALACSLPGGNLLTLGYLVHAGGRVAATGRFRDGFAGVQRASKLAGVLVGIWLVWMPVGCASQLSQDAAIIAPGSRLAQGWHWATLTLGVVVVVHIGHALARGGRLRHFLVPSPIRLVRDVGSWRWRGISISSVRERVLGLRWHEFLWTGIQVDLAAMGCLAPPTLLLIGATRCKSHGLAVLLSAAGLVTLMWVAGWLPLAQGMFGLERRFRGLLSPRSVFRRVRAAPFSCHLATATTLALALPLYLLRVELPARDLAWLPALPFVLVAFGTRLLTGWAVFRATHPRGATPGPWVWIVHTAMLAVLLFYAVTVSLSQYVSWNGSMDLLRQHAFLMPGLWNTP
jgi:hypothetical protein